jgi:hypothetical protein
MTVAARLGLRPDETLIVTVTPIAEGVAVPCVVTGAMIATVAVAAHYWSWPHNHFWELMAVAVPSLIVLSGRTLRWWSHRVVITDQRVMEFAGSWHRHSVSYEFEHVVGVHVHQSRADRLLRRGTVALEDAGGSAELRRVRRPDAFARVLDHVRRPASPELVVEVAGEIGPSEIEPDFDADLDVDDAPLRWRHLFGDGGAR